jgi:hypothetical protein
MQNMTGLLKMVRQEPLSFLPRISLDLWMQFRSGYQNRIRMEGGHVDWGFDRLDFHRWLTVRFEVQDAQAIADTSIVSSFFISEERAFNEYFDLLDEYLASGPKIPAQESSFPYPSQPFAELVREIRRRPAMYIGCPTFLGCSASLMGDAHAFSDLGLHPDRERKLFQEFQEWVELTKNRSGQFRHWFKIVEFWSVGDHSAYRLFWHWLDQFASQKGSPDIFKPPE